MKFKKVSTGQGDDYTAGCLLDYAYFKDNCRIIRVYWIKQKALDADSRVIQELVFQENPGRDDDVKLRLYTILEKSKETVSQFYNWTAKVLWEYINGWVE